MTQEELDTIVNRGSNTFFLKEDKEESNPINKVSQPYGYSQDTAHLWPMPATNENKMVCQLDDVTRESEEKASEIFDIVEEVSNEIDDSQDLMRRVVPVFEANAKFFALLCKKFPDVKIFSRQCNLNKSAIEKSDEITQSLQSLSDSLMSVMDTMQYQDIHRQKIERVINVMRSLSKYMNNLLEGRVEDIKRVSSAQHIAGDSHNETVSLSDIDDLLAQFGKK